MFFGLIVYFFVKFFILIIGDAWIEFHHDRKEITSDQRTSLSNAIQVSREVTKKKLIEQVVYLKGDTIMIDDY